MQGKLPELTIFFPAFNEAGNIEEAIKQALSIAPKVARKFEVLVINDGSTDATRQIAKRMEQKYRHVRLVNQRNRGYGGALKRGFKEAKYEWIFYTDSDLQFDISELQNLVALTKNFPLVLGYRVNRAEGLRRHILAKALKIWNRVLLNFPQDIEDVDCAFKLINRQVLAKTEPLISEGAMISSELLLKSHQAGFEYSQVGVSHFQRRLGNPTGSNLVVVYKAIVETFRLRLSLAREQLKVVEPISFFRLLGSK